MLASALRTVEQVFGKTLPPLTSEQQLQLEQVVVDQIKTLFYGTYQTKERGKRNRALTRRCLLDAVLMKDVAQEFGITTSRVGQLRLKALRMLRHPTRSGPMQDVFNPRGENGWRKFRWEDGLLMEESDAGTMLRPE